MGTYKRRKLDFLSQQTGESHRMVGTLHPSELDRSVSGAASDSDGDMEPGLEEEPQFRTPATPESKYDSEDSSEDQDEAETTGIEASQIAEMPFTIEYVPPELKGRQKTKSQSPTDRGQQKVWPKEQECLDNEEMVVRYKVLPRTEWDKMKSFQSFLVYDQRFKVGDHLYIKHSRGQNNNTILAPDHLLFWVCQVLEIKAVDAEHVYVRVFWLYWPDELPAGRGKHHGKHELLMSNHMEIVDARTVAGMAHISRWNEHEDDDDEGESEGRTLAGLYWRQWYNSVTKRVSAPRTHCVCKSAYNPDKVLVACPDTSCGLWMHDHCLIEDALIQTHKERVLQDTFELKRLKEYAEAKNLESTKKRARQPAIPWAGKLEATLDLGASPVKAVLKDLVKGRKDTWERNLVCLSCQTPLD